MPPRVDLPAPLLALIRNAFGQVEPQDLVLLKRGGYGNANVYRLETAGQVWVIKEFYSRSWLIRHTFGRFMIHREVQALVHLDVISGVPGGARRLGPAALAEAFIEGETLVKWHRTQLGKLPKSFFLDMERLVAEMHRAGYAHLDLRNLRNIICTRETRPCFLDFQSSICTTGWPRFFRRIMENTDRSSIYKAWILLCEEPLDAERETFLKRTNSIRKLWILKGYMFAGVFHKLALQRRLIRRNRYRARTRPR